MSRQSGRDDGDGVSDDHSMTEGRRSVGSLDMDDSISQSTEGGGELEAPLTGHPWFQHRRPAERRTEEFAPTAEWVDAFRAQATAETFASALGYAYKRAEVVALAGVQVDDDYVNALVQDAIGDTASGRIRWRFDRVSLANHIKDTIRLRTTRQIARAGKFRHQSIEASADDGEADERPTEVEASLALRSGSADRDDVAVSDVVVQVFDAISGQLVGDSAALAILDAYRNQLTDRREVMEHTGFDEDQYHNARRRFARAVLKLPEELRSAAAEVMNR
jgi:hypothetical protein